MEERSVVSSPKKCYPQQLKKRSIFSGPNYTLEYSQFCLSENKIAGEDTQIAGAKSDKRRQEHLRDISSPEESSKERGACKLKRLQWRLPTAHTTVYSDYNLCFKPFNHFNTVKMKRPCNTGSNNFLRLCCSRELASTLLMLHTSPSSKELRGASPKPLQCLLVEGLLAPIQNEIRFETIHNRGLRWASPSAHNCTHLHKDGSRGS